MTDAPWVLKNGEKGLLAKGQFEDRLKKLTDFSSEIEKETDPKLVCALFRE